VRIHKKSVTSDLRILVIDHVQHYNYHTGDNGKVWNKLMLQIRQSSKKRAQILEGYKEGKYRLLCANCNRISELTRIGCGEYIQNALHNKYSGSWDQRTYGWSNKFNLLKDMGGRCSRCGIGDLAVLEIHHVELFHHSKNGKEWKFIQVKIRRNKTYRLMILQGFKEGKYSLLCCNCNKLDAQKQGRSGPYIQQALIQLDRLNINNGVEDICKNNRSILQIIQLNIVVSLLYLFMLFCLFYHCGSGW
jgi:hypothetical protein